MEWEKQPPQQAEEPSGGMFVKVMTDEQMEVLRKQIAAYATICDQLVELHKSLTAQNDLAGNLYCNPLIASGTHKITGRQRWTPTPTQLQILERMFDQGIGTPSKQKIKEITAELSQHGQISETNVYNWFQNRRARSKRKQQAAPANKDESELETVAESPDEKKTKPQEFQAEQILTSTAEDPCFQDHSVHLEPLNDKIDAVLPPEGSSKFCDDFSPMPFYGGVLSNPRIDGEHLIETIEISGNYSPYLQEDDYNME